MAIPMALQRTSRQEVCIRAAQWDRRPEVHRGMMTRPRASPDIYCRVLPEKSYARQRTLIHVATPVSLCGLRSRILLLGLTSLGRVVTFAVDRWNFLSHGPQICRQLPAMVD